KALVRQFGISRSTAYERLAAVCGETSVTVTGYRRRVRTFYRLKRLWLGGRARRKACSFRMRTSDNSERASSPGTAIGRISSERAPPIFLSGASGRPVRTKFHPLFN